MKAGRKFGDNQFSDETGLSQRYIWEAEQIKSPASRQRQAPPPPDRQDRRFHP